MVPGVPWVQGWASLSMGEREQLEQNRAWACSAASGAEERQLGALLCPLIFVTEQKESRPGNLMFQVQEVLLKVQPPD